MPTDAKRQAVTDLADLLRGSSALAVADYRGLTVAEMHIVRRSLRASGVSLKIAKNRLLKIAADQAGLDDLKPLLDGPTAIATTDGDEVGLARALQDAFRPYKAVTVRGGLLAGQPVSAADLQRLATLPGRDVLLGRLAGGMVAPLSGMAAVLAANLRNLVGVLSAVADQKQQSEGAPALADEAPPVTDAAPEAEAGATESSSEATTAEAEAPEAAQAADVADGTETPAPADAASAPEAETPAEETDTAAAAATEAVETDDAAPDDIDPTASEPAEGSDESTTD
jgi:large subunit ribosomal protein L10